MKNVNRQKLVPLAALTAALVSTVLYTERPARADVPPPNMTCGNKKAGDSCVDDDKKSGTCTAQKCTRMGAVPGPNGTTERKIVEYDCTMCVVGNPAPATSGSPSSPTEKKGCNTSGAGTGDASLFVLGALGLIAWRRNRR